MHVISFYRFSLKTARFCVRLSTAARSTLICAFGKSRPTNWSRQAWRSVPTAYTQSSMSRVSIRSLTRRLVKFVFYCFDNWKRRFFVLWIEFFLFVVCFFSTKQLLARRFAPSLKPTSSTMLSLSTIAKAWPN